MRALELPEIVHEEEASMSSQKPTAIDIKFIVMALTPIILFFLTIIISIIGSMIRDKLESVTQSMNRMEVSQATQNDRIIHLEDFLPAINKRLEKMEEQNVARRR